MFLAGLLLTVGCATRVVSEVLAYQNYAPWAWRALPVSALTELSALTLFAINMAGTFLLQPTHSVKEPMVARIEEAARLPKNPNGQLARGPGQGQRHPVHVGTLYFVHTQILVG